MATVGQALTAPETGWQRYDDRATGIKYRGTWTQATTSPNYLTTMTYSNTPGSYIEFDFTGTLLRIMSATSNSRSASIPINIDGVTYNYSQHSPTAAYQVIVFEKLDLPPGTHRVRIDVTSSATVDIDSIDIEASGTLAILPATTGQLRTDVKDMEIGDYIKCYYVWNGTSGALPTAGILAWLGATSGWTGGEKPITGEATSSNQSKYFFFVKVAKGLLVADRVCQHTISWNTLNSGRVIQGLPWDNGNIVPVMTSNTAPLGRVSASPSNREPWYAFNGLVDANTSNDCWQAASHNSWISYTFTSPKKVVKYSLTAPGASWSGWMAKSWVFEGSHDGINFDVLDRVTNASAWAGTEKRSYVIANDVEYLHYRVSVSATFNTGSGPFINAIEMYDTVGIIRSLTGGVAYAKLDTNIIPPMTSNASTMGIASSSSEETPSYGAWSTMDRVRYAEGSTLYWCTPRNVTTGWLAYKFTSPQIVTGYRMSTIKDTAYGPTRPPKDWTFEGSLDGNAWVVLDTHVGETWTSGESKMSKISNNTAYLHYRVNITKNNGDIYLSVDELEMYTDLSSNVSSSTVDYGQGAWPSNNEWDKYIVNFPTDKIAAGKTVDDVFHWKDIFTWTQDTVRNGMVIDGASTSSTGRTIRGVTTAGRLSFGISGTAYPTVGFRPVFEYKEV